MIRCAAPFSPFSRAVSTPGRRDRRAHRLLVRRNRRATARSSAATTSGSFRPWPVTVQTIRLPSGMRPATKCELRCSFARGAQKPGDRRRARRLDENSLRDSRASVARARISSSLTMSIIPPDSAMAAIRLLPARGIPDPDRGRDRLGPDDHFAAKNRRRAFRLEADHPRPTRRLSRPREIPRSPPSRP